MDTALERAAAAVGGVAALGRALGISSQAISQWERAPYQRVLEIERLTGVSRHDLRPDVYPHEAIMPTPAPARKRQQRAAE